MFRFKYLFLIEGILLQLALLSKALITNRLFSHIRGRIYSVDPLLAAQKPWKDVSPLQDGGILKTIINKGDETKGCPAYGDTVTIILERLDANGNIVMVPEFQEKEDYKLTFDIGQDADVFPGIHYGVLSMAIGEVARLDLTSTYAVPAAKKDVSCQVTLVKIHDENRVGVGEDYGNGGGSSSSSSSGSSDAMSTFQRKVEENDGNNPLTAELLKSTSRDPGMNAQQAPVFYDPVKHKLDPRRCLDGSGEGHVWHETVDTMEVSVPLPSYVTSKDDLSITIKKNELWIKLTDAAATTVLGGPLFGFINPSGSNWAIEENEGALFMTQSLRVVLHLEKGFGHRELWASVFNRAYLHNQKKS